MTVRVERTFDLPASRERVWEFMSDPKKRADAISVVERFELRGENEAVWHVRLPVPFVDRTVAVETEDVERDPPRHVKFVGTGRAMRVIGVHDLEETDSGTRVVNRFIVEGRVPGVERYFKRHLDEEFDNLERALRADLGVEA